MLTLASAFLEFKEVSVVHSTIRCQLSTMKYWSWEGAVSFSNISDGISFYLIKVKYLTTP